METTEVKILSKDRVYDGYFKVDKYTIQSGNEKPFTREVFERGNSVAALVYDRIKNCFVLTDQYRMGAQKELLEIVAGSMDKDGESPEETIKREMVEEIGYEFDESAGDSIIPIGSAYVSPGGTSEHVHIFFVNVHKKISEGGGVENENIKIVNYPVEEIFPIGLAYNDLKTAYAIQWFFAVYKKGKI